VTAAIAVVTGGGTGIGRDCALRFSARGMDVVVAGRTRATLDHVAADAASNDDHGTVRPVVADCSTEAGIAAIADAVGDAPVGALVHSAGLNTTSAFDTTSRAEFDALVATNLAAPYFLTQALLPNLVSGAGVVFVGSVAARRGRDRHSGYGATKAALSGLTVNLAAELGPDIRVNCVSPGGTDTEMLARYRQSSVDHLDEEQRRRVRIADASRVLLGRIAQPDEVAATIVHLALDATAVTGVDLVVDVGYSAS